MVKLSQEMNMEHESEERNNHWIAAVAVPLGIYTTSPLFINTEINEPLPLL
ncbi:MAG: hypothetical protein M3275_14605 [Thermoproteota archaeon]|nr:hypothetical protein [Thermoproteota archaeon]